MPLFRSADAEMLRPAPSVIALTEADARELATARAAARAAEAAARVVAAAARAVAAAGVAAGPTADQRIGLAPAACPK